MVVNVIIVLIENFPCNDRYELEAREKYYIKLNNDKIVNNNMRFKYI